MCDSSVTHEQTLRLDCVLASFLVRNIYSFLLQARLESDTPQMLLSRVTTIPVITFKMATPAQPLVLVVE